MCSIPFSHPRRSRFRFKPGNRTRHAGRHQVMEDQTRISARGKLLMSNPWVGSPSRETFVVGVADMIASNDATAEIVTHSLSSCLGVTAYDPVRHVGGLLHLMLPDSTIDPAKGARVPCMFADTGVP